MIPTMILYHGGGHGLAGLARELRSRCEDVIARQLLGAIPYPALAGIGNLYGAEVNFAPWSLNVEGVRVFDDYFRWYTGHRVYHVIVLAARKEGSLSDKLITVRAVDNYHAPGLGACGKWRGAGGFVFARLD